MEVVSWTIFGSHGHGSVEMVQRRGHYSDEFRVNMYIMFLVVVSFC